jgi:pilus assembly protein Flp/PilA
MLFAPREKGQGLIEYALLLSLVALVVIFIIRMLGPKAGNTYSTINSSVP